jgi:hypothetical protein
MTLKDLGPYVWYEVRRVDKQTDGHKGDTICAQEFFGEYKKQQ